MLSQRFLIVAAVGAVILSGAAYYALQPSPDAAFESALLALEQGDASLVSSALRRLDRRPGYSAHVRLLEGAFFIRAGRTGAALTQLFPIPKLSPLRPRFLFYGAQALHGADRPVEAEILLRELTQLDPQYAEAWRWLGIIYFDLGAYDHAVYALSQLANLAPLDYRPHRLMGLMNYEMQRDTEAVECYKNALDRAPPEEVRRDVLQEMAQSLVALRRYDEAREAVLLCPQSEMTELILAQCAWSQGNPEGAREHLTAAQQFGTQEPMVSLLEAEILISEKNIAGAIAVLEENVRRHPHDAESHYRLALALRESGDTERAEDRLSRWNKEKDLATRLQELNRKAIEHPHDAVVRDQLAEVCDALDKPELAELWRRAAEACRVPTPAP